MLLSSCDKTQKMMLKMEKVLWQFRDSEKRKLSTFDLGGPIFYPIDINPQLICGISFSSGFSYAPNAKQNILLLGLSI